MIFHKKKEVDLFACLNPLLNKNSLNFSTIILHHLYKLINNNGGTYGKNKKKL